MLLTHAYPGAVAWLAVAQVVIGDDLNGIMLSTVQIIPGARVVFCDAFMCLAVQSHCNCDVRLCPISWGPADRAQAVLTMCIALYMLRHTGD